MNDATDDFGLLDGDIGDLLEQSWERERERLEAELEAIDQQLAARSDLYDRTVEELEGKVEWYVERLGLLYKRSQGKHGTRDQMKARIEELYQALHEERRQHWQDRQDLLAERRDLQRERAALDDDLIDALVDLE